LHQSTAPADIAKCLREAMALDAPAREAMAQAARALAIERYSTASVTASLAGLYRSLMEAKA
jgi:hypothetical protein